MNDSPQWSVVSRWHCRVLGVIWVSMGLFCVWDVHRAYWREQAQVWVPLIAGLPYVIAGVNFARCRLWACVLMGVLMVIAGFIFAYCILMAGFLGNRVLLHWMLIGLGLAAYTGCFVLFVVVSRREEFL